MHRESDGLLFQNSIFIWIALATGAVLLIPLIAMQVTAEVDWTLPDFIVMGLMLFCTTGLFVLVARRIQRRARLIAGGVFLAAFLYAWAELGVGLFTSLGS